MIIACHHVCIIYVITMHAISCIMRRIIKYFNNYTYIHTCMLKGKEFFATIASRGTGNARNAASTLRILHSRKFYSSQDCQRKPRVTLRVMLIARTAVEIANDFAPDASGSPTIFRSLVRLPLAPSSFMPLAVPTKARRSLPDN